jgi:hypothetical protein
MGTNYYRIPTEEELQIRKQKLLKQISEMDVSPRAVIQGFSIENPDSWDRISPWDEFTKETEIHLGKRSGGWKFCWNFHEEKYYNSKETLEAFVKSGRVVDEYGTEVSSEAFLQMAYEWCTEGWDSQTYYQEHPGSRISWIDYEKNSDRYIDGLRISSSVDFS